MKTTCLVAALAWLALSSAPAGAVDLTTIERHLVKEPAYQTNLPKYGLLVFEPEAQTRVWVVIDGDVLYIDRNGNGDLTEADKRVAGQRSGKWLEFRAGRITTAEGKWRDLRLRIRDFHVADGRCTGMDIITDGKQRQFVGFDDANPFRFAQRSGQAPILHLEGPLSMKLYGEPPTLIAGQEVELNIAIGTPGVGPGSFCAIQCCTVLDCKASPVAEIDFPHRDPNRGPPKVRIPIADD
jgi:hypothetical protein